MINTRKSRGNSIWNHSPPGEETDELELEENMFGVMVPVDRTSPVNSNGKPKIILENVTINEL